MLLKQIIQLSVGFFNNLLAFLLVKRVIKFIHEFLYSAIMSLCNFIYVIRIDGWTAF